MKLDAARLALPLPARAVTLSALDWGGSGPLAVLAHANGFCAALWDPVARLLRERYHVVGFDARGQGDSSRPWGPDAYAWPEFGLDWIAVVEALAARFADAPGPVYGIGHSFGGTSLLDAAVQRSDLFARLALVDPVLHPPGAAASPEGVERKRQLAETARRRRSVWPSRQFVRETWRARDLFAGWDPRVFDLYMEEGFRDRPDGQVELKCPGEVEGAVFDGRETRDVYALAEKLRVPAVILFAARGHFDRSTCEDLAERALDLRIEDVPLGHLLPMEGPEEVATRLLRFGL